MKRFTIAILALPLLGGCASDSTASAEVQRWEARAENVTITRDDWGIPHVYAPTDADAVFGLVYAQAEDDFQRVELNYLNAMGRLAEAEGEAEIWRDLRMKMFIDPDEMRELYASSPEWLRALMDGFADGLNYYLHTHPEVTPRVITRFEPWMALTFTEGSIGGDIERISMRELERFYGDRTGPQTAERTDLELLNAPSLAEADAPGVHRPMEPTGSNGFAIAPSNSASGNALLLINPHTSFYFRAEAHARSDEGLNAYGAITWGQFFIYQGFNERTGWMHTSTGADAIDEYAETIVETDDGLFYQHGDEQRPVTTREITVPYRDGESMAERTFSVHYTHHGPVVRAADGRWITVSLMQEPVKALTQSYMRTKAEDYADFRETMELHTNSSNNTVYADADGAIAYFHANFIPRRDPQFDWSRPVDGSNPATEWQGLHTVDETVGVLNPPNGWIQNTNNWPFSAAGEFSPRQEDFPAYMATYRENPRGVNAVRVLQDKTDFTLETLIDAAYDSYLSAFEPLIPTLLSAYDRLAGSDARRDALSGPIDVLRGWDYRFGVESVATSVAIFWGNELWSRVSEDARDAGMSVYQYMEERTTSDERLDALAAATDQLAEDFGQWDTPWGEINRFQRLTGDIVQPFDDSQPSVAVPFATSRWGSLAAYGQRTFNGTKRIYGTRGNSFVAVVEFGNPVRAKAVTAGGQSGDPNSPHFADQIERYAAGDLRDVYFTTSDLVGHTEEVYHPGQR